MAYTGSYDADDLPTIFLDIVGRIGAAMASRIELVVGGLLIALIISIYLGLPTKAMAWLKSFSK